MKKYLPQQFEEKWAKKWLEDKIYCLPSIREKKKKMYVLDMFPYPSGAGLHVGHPRGYTATDILARYYRMQGYAVLHPMGWDAFGLPAENAAIKAKKNPLDMVPQNIANFKRQLLMLGFSYDWDREFATTDPDYYRWTQWLFIQFFKMGLLYKKNTPINFCPSCKTGLAEEEVLADGRHERCGNRITKKYLPQWIFRITAYADRLLDGLKGLDWPTGILEMQKNWIGRKEGINIFYPVEGTAELIECFTTRPETNYGATFIVLAPEHSLVEKLIANKLEIKIDTKIRNAIVTYVEKAKSKTELERQVEQRQKSGVFTGLYAINRLNKKRLPIWISDFVLSSVGTGAVVGVPGHDIRDFDFAHEFNIEVRRVVVGRDGKSTPISDRGSVDEGEGIVINSDFLDGMPTEKAKNKIIDYLEKKKWGKKTVNYHLRDWIFSRQRYWGEPIPLVFCASCASKGKSWFDTDEAKKFRAKLKNKVLDLPYNLDGWFPIREEQLPLKLPYVKSYEPSDKGESPLAVISDFVQTDCPNCGGKARRETDTMPNWAGSCWYFLRFADPHNSKEAWDKKIVRELCPVDWYIGGAEHAVLHLLYARFWVKALKDLKLLDHSEPFLRLRNVGMILAEDNRKMSKSYGNVINPDDIVKEFGADALRTYEMFMAPFSQEIAWSTRTLQGVYRFLSRVWSLYYKQSFMTEKEGENPNLLMKLNQTIKKVEKDIIEIKFNTAIAAMMEFINDWEKTLTTKKGAVNPSQHSQEERVTSSLSRENAKKFLQILAPFAPFITEELWHNVFSETSSIHLSCWPKVDKQKLVASDVNLPVQVDGKVRAVLTVSASSINDENSIISLVLSQERVKKWLQGKKYRVIYIKGRIVNIVTAAN